MPTQYDDYGRDRYVWQDGQRLRIRMVRTIRPREAESNAEFEQRMNGVAAVVATMTGILSVELEFERIAGSIVQCAIDIAHDPRPEAVKEDPRAAGGAQRRSAA